MKVNKPLFLLSEVHTASIAAEIWGIPYSTLKDDISRYKKFSGQIERGLIRKEGRVWLVTERAMREIYGEAKREDC